MAPEPIHIKDPDDPRIEIYRQVRERDLVGRKQRFIAEGEVVLRLLLRRSRFPIESVLLAERRAEILRPILADVPPGVPVYVAARAVMDRIVGFPIHRGVLAAGWRVDDPAPEDLLARMPPRALVLALIGLANHDNVGGLFRNAAAFGVDAVLLDRTCCDPLYRKAIRVSVGASLVVPFTRAPSADALLHALECAGFKALALSPRGLDTLADVNRPRRTALILGTEGPGLPEGILRRLPSVRIPMAPGFDSLNVATAGGIALHHLATAPDETDVV